VSLTPRFYRGVVPFLGGLLLCAALLFLFPEFATLLPRLLMKQAWLNAARGDLSFFCKERANWQKHTQQKQHGPD
jgi:hypothetical protein